MRIVAEAMKRATIDKDRLRRRSRPSSPCRSSASTSKAYAEALAGEIRRGVKAEVPRFNAGAPPARTPRTLGPRQATATAFTMTHSLGMPSGVITTGLGFMYNGCMGVFDPRPGRAGSIAPGKARFSSVVPSIVFKDGKPHLVIGAPGAHADRHGRAAGDPERTRFRHDHGRRR